MTKNLKNTPKTENASDAALRLKAVIDTAIDGIITIDEMGVVETINPAAARLFGYKRQEVIGEKVNMLMPAPYKSEHDGYMARYLQTGEARIIGIGREVEGKRKDGSVFPLRLAVSEVFLNEKRIFTGIIHDLSDVKKAEAKIVRLNQVLEEQNEVLEHKVRERTQKLAKVIDQLLETNEKLENEIHERHLVEAALRKSESELKDLLEKEKELSELKSRFVSMASHEFRTPLSTILSSIELVEAYNKTEQQSKREKHIARIKSAVSHLTGILNDFLSLSRLEEGKVRLQPETFNLAEFCVETIDELKSILKPGQELKHIENNSNTEITLDKKCLRHILFNLLSNAIKYSNDGTPVEFITDIRENTLYVTVRDYGIGIPLEDQKYLFTRFFRAHNVENIKGTGLGLNIVRRYIELLSGEISFESKEGEGTIFYVQIPIWEAQNQYSNID